MTLASLAIPVWSSRSCPSSSIPVTACVRIMVRTARPRKVPRFRICASGAGNGGWESRRVLSMRGGIFTIRWCFAHPTVSCISIASETWCFGNAFDFVPAAAPMVVSTPWGRIGFAICADMIYRHVWSDYRDRIDLAVVPRPGPTSRIETLAAGTGSSATSGRCRVRSRRRLRWISAFRSCSRISAAKPAPRSPCWARGFVTGSPARAAL